MKPPPDDASDPKRLRVNPHYAPPLPPTYIEVDEDGDETEHVGLGDLARAILHDGRDRPKGLWRPGGMCLACRGTGMAMPALTSSSFVSGVTWCSDCDGRGSARIDALGELERAIKHESDDLAKYAHGGRLIPRQED